MPTRVAGPAGPAGSAGLAGIAASVALTFVTGLLGSSVVQAPLPGPAPPFTLGVHLPAGLVIAMQCAALVCGAVGLGLACLAACRGWSPEPRRLLAAGVLGAAALVCVPPMGTADPHAYASYGRILTLGANPYVAAPEDFPHDPVASAAKPPWTEEPSPYGPLATAEQAAISWLAGDSLSWTVFALSAVNALAFLATGLILHALARGDRNRQVRAALLWTLNPLLLYELVAGAHLDALGIVLAVGAVTLLSRSTMVSGALVGLAAMIKAPLAIVGGGLLWGARTLGRHGASTTDSVRGWVRSGAPVVVGATVVAIAAYAIAGVPALQQLGRTSGYISLATPWHLLEGPLAALLGGDVSRGLIRALAYCSLIALTVLFCYGLPQRTDGRVSSRVARVALAFGLAWLLTAPYVLPWYDALAWALLAFLPWSRFDGLLLARTTVLAIPYVASLPARLPEDMEWFVTIVRARVTPALMLLVVVAFIVVARQRLGPPPAQRGGGGRAAWRRERRRHTPAGR